MPDKLTCTVQANGDGTYTVSCDKCGKLDTRNNRYEADSQKKAHEKVFND